MVRLVGSAGSLFSSYSARAWGSAGAWAQAARATADASAMPLASVRPACRHQGPFVAPRRLDTTKTTVMDHAPVCVGARLGAVLAGLISGLRAVRHIVSVLKQIAAAPTVAADDAATFAALERHPIDLRVARRRRSCRRRAGRTAREHAP